MRILAQVLVDFGNVNRCVEQGNMRDNLNIYSEYMQIANQLNSGRYTFTDVLEYAVVGPQTAENIRELNDFCHGGKKERTMMNMIMRLGAGKVHLEHVIIISSNRKIGLAIAARVAEANIRVGEIPENLKKQYNRCIRLGNAYLEMPISRVIRGGLQRRLERKYESTRRHVEAT